MIVLVDSEEIEEAMEMETQEIDVLVISEGFADSGCRRALMSVYLDRREVRLIRLKGYLVIVHCEAKHKIWAL